MKCPKCKTLQHCPCKVCSKSPIPEGEVRWIWDEDGEHILCGYPGCDYINHADSWVEEEIKIVEAELKLLKSKWNTSHAKI